MRGHPYKYPAPPKGYGPSKLSGFGMLAPAPKVISYHVYIYIYIHINVLNTIYIHITKLQTVAISICIYICIWVTYNISLT